MADDGAQRETNSLTTNKQVTPTTTTPIALQKLSLAEHRYGREEMLLYYADTVGCLPGISNIPTLVLQQPVSPYAMSPISPEEQMVLSCGSVNSGGYPSRGRGGYYSGRGRGGRGRGGGMGGRPDYYRTSSGSGDDYKERGGGYYRSNSDSHWSDENRTERGRAIHDSNWRSSQSKDTSTAAPWSKPWAGPSKGSEQQGKKPWQPLPEWATDDTSNNGKSGVPSVGEFSSKGRFIEFDKSQEIEDNEEQEINEDVFTDDIPITTDNKEEKQHNDTSKGTSVASTDSVEEMERRFEKAAESILFTEDEDTPSPSPNPAVQQDMPSIHQTVPSVHQTMPSVHQPVPSVHQTVPSVHQNMPSIHKQLASVHQPVTKDPLILFDQWFYQDPQKELQGPFSNIDMQNWYTAGYFQMDLLVRRSCDLIMLPLGQVMRIWGRSPFIPGPHPPPIQPSEAFWQQLFQHQHQLFPQSQGLVMGGAKPHPVPPSPQSTEPSPIWGVVKDTKVKEEQWPDLGVGTSDLIGQDMVAKQLPEEAKQQKQYHQKEEKRVIDVHEVLSEKQQLEIERKKHEEQQKRERKLREEEERKRREMERLQREEERKKREAEELRKEEERRIEEQQRLELELLKEKQKLEQQKFKQEVEQQFWEATSSPTQSVSVGVSLLQIQKEEAARELVRQQEMQLYLQQQQQQQAQQQTKAAVGWSTVTTPTGNKQTSFLEIQQEQKQQVGVVSGRGRGINKNPSAMIPSVPTAPTSWSKITAGNRPAQNPTWGSSQQSAVRAPPNARPLTQQVSPKETPPTSFWDECTLETPSNRPMSLSSNRPVSLGRGNGKGRGREREVGNGNRPGSNKHTKEEVKIRQLFAATASPDEQFTEWCASELVKYNSDVDAATFVSLLLQVESAYEVHDYIKSFLGETDEVHAFAKQFLEKRQKVRNYTSTGQQQKKSGNDSSSAVTSSSSSMMSSNACSSASRNSKKKKKVNKMQKMSPSDVLGFTVNAAERPNAGEIHSVKDVM